MGGVLVPRGAVGVPIGSCYLEGVLGRGDFGVCVVFSGGSRC